MKSRFESIPKSKSKFLKIAESENRSIVIKMADKDSFVAV